MDEKDVLLRLSAVADGRLIPGETLIFLDEVQKCPEAVTYIKFLVDEGSYRYVLSGSLLGVELKNVRNEEIVQRVNKILVGWDNYFQCGHPARMFNKVNWYVRQRLYLHFNRKSQRGYVLKYAPNFYQELQSMGLHMLRRRRK